MTAWLQLLPLDLAVLGLAVAVLLLDILLDVRGRTLGWLTAVSLLAVLGASFFDAQPEAAAAVTLRASHVIGPNGEKLAEFLSEYSLPGEPIHTRQLKRLFRKVLSGRDRRDSRPGCDAKSRCNS